MYLKNTLYAGDVKTVKRKIAIYNAFGWSKNVSKDAAVGYIAGLCYSGVISDKQYKALMGRIYR